MADGKKKRELTSHLVPGAQNHVRVCAEDEPGPSGASHIYTIVAEEKPGAAVVVKVKFQNGPISEGVNGITNEALLAILMDRLTGFQGGEFPCPENREALSHLQQAMAALNRRTIDRLNRGVEGTLQR